MPGCVRTTSWRGKPGYGKAQRSKYSLSHVRQLHNEAEMNFSVELLDQMTRNLSRVEAIEAA